MSFALMFLSLPLFGNSVVGTALDDFHAPSEEGYYYFQPEDVGSQAFHNPVQIFIEGGFGALYNRKLDTFDWGQGFDNLHQTLLNPVDTVDDYGWQKFFWYEFVPHAGQGQNYVANWTWHFLGLGMRTRLLEEYYQYNGYRYPRALAWSTAYALHYFNEVIQASKFKDRRRSIDALPDLLFFDWAGGLFFSFEPINKFMSRTLNMRDWSYQTQLNPTTNRLINNGQIFWLRYPIADGPVSVGALSGELTTTFNLGVEFRNRHQLSVGVGGKSKTFLANPDGTGDTEIVGMVVNYGLYYSINDKPVVVAVYEPSTRELEKDHPEFANEFSDKTMVNVYPGLIDIDGFRPGFTFSYQKNAFFFGISSGQSPLGFILSTSQEEAFQQSS